MAGVVNKYKRTSTSAPVTESAEKLEAKAMKKVSDAYTLIGAAICLAQPDPPCSAFKIEALYGAKKKEIELALTTTEYLKVLQPMRQAKEIVDEDMKGHDDGSSKAFVASSVTTFADPAPTGKVRPLMPDITWADIIITAGSSGSVWGCPPHWVEQEAGSAGGREPFPESTLLKMNDNDVWIKNLNIDTMAVRAAGDAGMKSYDVDHIAVKEGGTTGLAFECEAFAGDKVQSLSLTLLFSCNLFSPAMSSLLLV